MLTSYATGILGVVVVSAIWIGVQKAWRNTFADAAADPDVLARRTGCGGCGGMDRCDRPCSNEADWNEERTDD